MKTNMIMKLVGKVKNNKETVKALIMAFMVGFLTRPEIAYAASYTQPLDNLKTVLTSIAVAAGAVLLIYGGIRFAIAFQKMDQNGEHSAINTMIAAGVLLGISALVTALS